MFFVLLNTISYFRKGLQSCIVFQGILFYHDKLILDVQTNGTVSSEDVVKKSVNILSDLLGIFDTINEEPEIENVQDKQIEDMKLQSILNMTVDELELSARSSNCLKRAGIENVNDLKLDITQALKKSQNES